MKWMELRGSFLPLEGWGVNFVLRSKGEKGKRQVKFSSGSCQTKEGKEGELERGCINREIAAGRFSLLVG